VDDPLSEQAASVRRTIDWASRCRSEFNRLIESKGIPDHRRPLLYAVVQGGGSFELRRQCAEALLEIGFDGFGFGGWPLDQQGHLLVDMLAYTREIIPSRYTLHALGIAHPINIWKCVNLGYDLFDGALPTRDARHGRLYTFATNPAEIISADSPTDWFRFIYILDKQHIKDTSPISPYCSCPVCQKYSMGYLQHLFKIGDGLAARLATIHNLCFMAELTALLRHGDG
jgi:queuine tRNA-ribosyltransferase